MLSGTIDTKGGPVTDANGRVLTAAATTIVRPVGGLYAAIKAAMPSARPA